MKEIYTIGHSTYPIEKLIERLHKYQINCLIDVRSTPFSQHAPQYNSPELKMYLNNISIIYIYMGKELGARQPDNSLYSKEGYLDFDKFRKTDLFKGGIERIKQGISKGYRIAIMCTEKDPLDCHRNILIARDLYEQDYVIKNILINGEVELQDKVEQRLLDLYFPNREQVTVFEYLSGGQKESELLKEAYKNRNKDIGFKKNLKEEDD